MTADKPKLSCAMTHDYDSSMNSLINGLPNNYKNKDGLLNRNSPHACAGESLPRGTNDHLPRDHVPGIRTTSSSAVDTLTFERWCAFLAVAVLRTRTSFSAFFFATMHLPRSPLTSTSPAFPLPVPHVGIFERMPPGLSAIRRRKWHFRRALHVVVMALNFWWSGSRTIPMELLGRTPSPSQKSIYRRIASLMLADGPSKDFSVLKSGRRFPQLLARLSELSGAVTKLGIGSGPYERIYPGHDVPLENSLYQELEPYKSLDASRLKVVGSGHWDATQFLSPNLCMAYRYPDCLLYDRTPAIWEFPNKMDPESEVLQLAKLWDARGLLFIHDVDLQKERKFELVRVFNCLKNSSCDRQIGDRRGRNAVEGKVAGPSSYLPTGPCLLDLVVDAKSETLSIVCTDRRDFYHQFLATTNRTLSNTVGPRLPINLLQDTMAFSEFSSRARQKKPDRTVLGDQLGVSKRQSFSKCHPGYCMASFKSVFQGDHAGVEIATDAHVGLLQSIGLLKEESRIVSGRPFYGDALCEGLVIDDYFAISKVPRSLLVDSGAVRCFEAAKAIYDQEAIMGSDDKDVKGERHAKIIGASVNASPQCQDRGHVLVSAPAEKRLALSWITLQACQLTHTTDALHLCMVGGWTSILMYRRPLMSILLKSFHLVDMNLFSASNPKMLKLPRTVATELVLLSVLAPLVVSDIAVGYCSHLFASDASLSKGAIVKSDVGEEITEVLWRSCRTKGGYSKLLDSSQSILSRCMDFEETGEQQAEKVDRPLAFRFDFIEIFAGAATVTAVMASRGYSVGCPIDISFSAELDVAQVRVLEWILYLVCNGLLKSLIVEPPCTTFSIMRRPALRSRFFPFGFDPEDPQTSIGTLLGYRAFQIMRACIRNGITALLENPWTSLIKFLPGWSILANSEHCQVVRCDSCAYGSIHLKSFAFLCAWADIAPISDRCDGSHEHVHVQGQFTKGSATYVERLSVALADVMCIGIKRLETFDEACSVSEHKGLESQLVNEVALSSAWSLESVWEFRVSSHINLLELSAVVRLVQRLVRKGKACRVVVLVDSNVVRCAASKGRSSSRALTKLLSRLAALCLVGGVYLVLGFVPTRLNPADDPTRDCSLRTPIAGLDIASWDRGDLFGLAEVCKCRRWASNWIRLVLLVLGPPVLSFANPAVYRRSPFPFGLASSVSVVGSDRFAKLDFDSTLGYPGEGPVTFFASNWGPLSFCLLVICAVLDSSHGVLIPRNAGDVHRQLLRSSRPPLQEGRPVLGVTNQHREFYIKQFEDWLVSQGIFLGHLLANHVTSIDLINELLVKFGRVLYAIGRPYNHYAETINAVAARKPIVRRQLQEAWNLAYAWVRDEPSVHHIALPWQILLAAISLCFTWGWIDLAGMLALSFGALLRVGEFTGAIRRDLLLPVDTGYTNQFALLSLREPKTRFTAARHQCAKLDVPDLLRVVHIAFSRLLPHQKLWPKSGQTLRTRFRQVMTELGVGPSVRLNGKSLDLGSLRPGGATWILQVTEDSEFLRRRGRWINSRVMEIYIQEISAFQFLAAVPSNAQLKIFSLCNFFPLALQGAEQFWESNIPYNVWYLLWRAQVTRT